MKKDRNSFFSQYGVSAYNTTPMGMPNIPSMQNNQMIPNMQYNYQETNDYESRINKLEREIKLLDTRISKLENQTPISTTTNTDYNFANSMYMV